MDVELYASASIAATTSSFIRLTSIPSVDASFFTLEVAGLTVMVEVVLVVVVVVVVVDEGAIVLVFALVTGISTMANFALVVVTFRALVS